VKIDGGFMNKKENLEGRTIDRRIILRHILVKWGGRNWAEVNRLRLWRVGGLL
jgi:hypothetical protein